MRESVLTKGKLHIITELCELGDLSKYIKQQLGWMEEHLILKVFTQVCLGLRFMHSRKILHRDIKAMNIFIKKNWEVRIGDFGIAKELKNELPFASTMTGTPFYLSPEMCEELPYDQKSDVWALGCLLYEMCSQTQPFKSEGYKGLKKMITKGGFELDSNF